MAFAHLELVLGGTKQPSLGCRFRELAHNFDVVCASLGSWLTRRSKRLFTFAYWHGPRYSVALNPHGEGSVTLRFGDSDQVHWPNTASAPSVADYATPAVCPLARYGTSCTSMQHLRERKNNATRYEWPRKDARHPVIL